VVGLAVVCDATLLDDLDTEGEIAQPVKDAFFGLVGFPFHPFARHAHPQPSDPAHHFPQHIQIQHQLELDLFKPFVLLR